MYVDTSNLLIAVPFVLIAPFRLNGLCVDAHTHETFTVEKKNVTFFNKTEGDGCNKVTKA